MGLLDFLKPRAVGPAPLPSGTFTVDRKGEILSSTVSSAIPVENLKQIGALVLKTFREAEPLELAFTDFVIQFGSLTLKAREMRGGAIIFLSPRGTPRK